MFVMDRLDSDAKLKEEKVLCNDRFKLHRAEDVHMTISPITTAAVLSHEDHNPEGLSLGPKTPKPNEENIDVPCDAKTSSAFISSPLPSVDHCSSPPNGSCFAAEVDASDDGSPKTPKGVFDPFAPGPADLELAPFCKKVSKVPSKFTPRRLKFDDFDKCVGNRNQDCDIETMSEEMILESVYTTLLEVVVQKQIEDFLAKNSLPPTTTVKTPPDRKLTGIANVCPAPPMKTATSKSSNLDIIRRKLEF